MTTPFPTPQPGVPGMPQPGPSAPTGGGLPQAPAGGGGIDWGAILEEQENDPGVGAIPPGPYGAIVKDTKLKPTNAGDMMINVCFEVVGGPYASKWVWTNIVFKLSSPKAMRYTIRKLKALGVDIVELQTNNTPIAVIAEQIKGREVIIDVSWESGDTSYNGEPQNDVENIKPANGPTAQMPSGPTMPGAANPPATGAGAPPVPNPAEAITPQSQADTPDNEPF